MGFQGLSPVMFESVSAVTATNSVELGTRRMVDGEEYVYCKNNTGSAATQGALMVKSLTSLTRSSTDALDLPMVAIKHADVPAASYFWGLVRGEFSGLTIAMSAGDLVTIGTDGVCATFITATLPTGLAFGKCLVAASANGKPGLCVRLFG